MASKELAFDLEARQHLLAGVEKLANAVKATLGPRGRNAVIDKSWGGPTVTKDGVTVAEEIQLASKAENMGAMLVKEAASKTSDDAGDGTTTSTVLAEALFREGLRYIAAGVDANGLVRGMKQGVEAACQAIDDLATPIKGKADVKNVATISANNDPEVGTIMADAFEKVGVGRELFAKRSARVLQPAQFVRPGLVVGVKPDSLAQRIGVSRAGLVEQLAAPRLQITQRLLALVGLWRWLSVAAVLLMVALLPAACRTAHRIGGATRAFALLAAYYASPSLSAMRQNLLAPSATSGGGSAMESPKNGV